MSAGTSEYLWTPQRDWQGQKFARLEEAAKEYDPRLVLVRDHGQYVIAIEVERGTFPPYDMYPVLGLGMDEADLPHPDDLKKRLFAADTVRHGDEMLDKMNAENEKIKAAKTYRYKQAVGEAAEAFEWGLSRMANDINKRKISVKMGEPVKRRRPEAK